MEPDDLRTEDCMDTYLEISVLRGCPFALDWEEILRGRDFDPIMGDPWPLTVEKRRRWIRRLLIEAGVSAERVLEREWTEEEAFPLIAGHLDRIRGQQATLAGLHAAPERGTPADVCATVGPTGNAPDVGVTRALGPGLACEYLNRQWTIEFEGRSLPVGNLKGAFYVAELVRNPGKSIACTQLVQRHAAWAGLVRSIEDEDAEDELHVQPLGADVMMDKASRDAAKKGIRQMEEAIAGALADGTSPETIGKTEAELAKTRRQLDASRNIHGKPRRLDDLAEKNRKSVRIAIDRFLETLDAEEARPLRNHLSAAIKFGLSCKYAPNPASTGSS